MNTEQQIVWYIRFRAIGLAYFQGNWNTLFKDCLTKKLFKWLFLLLKRIRYHDLSIEWKDLWKIVAHFIVIFLHFSVDTRFSKSCSLSRHPVILFDSSVSIWKGKKAYYKGFFTSSVLLYWFLFFACHWMVFHCCSFFFILLFSELFRIFFFLFFFFFLLLLLLLLVPFYFHFPYFARKLNKMNSSFYGSNRKIS